MNQTGYSPLPCLICGRAVRLPVKQAVKMHRGQKIGVSRERVRQIEKRAKEKLKRKLNSKTSFEPLS